MTVREKISTVSYLSGFGSVNLRGVALGREKAMELKLLMNKLRLIKKNSIKI